MTRSLRATTTLASSRLVALVGIENVVVVEAPYAVLVADKARRQQVKAIVAQLGQKACEEHAMRRKVHRPWSRYYSIDEGQRLKVKRIQVKRKASLSLQRQHRRAQHRVVVRGTTEIACGDRTVLLSECQTIFIRLGEIHRLASPGTVPLEVIAVRFGSYLSENDIVRLEDHYGR